MLNNLANPLFKATFNLTADLNWLYFQGLRKSLQDITADERSSIAVNPDDIFFSFMPEFDFQQNKQSILLGMNSN